MILACFVAILPRRQLKIAVFKPIYYVGDTYDLSGGKSGGRAGKGSEANSLHHGRSLRGCA
jgi:hypothetical protein